MTNGPQNGFTVRRYSQELDAAEALRIVFRAAGKQDEKYLLHWLLLRLSEHQVELVRILSAAFPELAKQLPAFFQKRVEDHRRAMRLAKLFGFRSASAVEEEAVRRAWEDARAMVLEVSPVRDEAIRRLVDDHREMLRRLCWAMVELVMQEPGLRGAPAQESLRLLLGGGGGT